MSTPKRSKTKKRPLRNRETGILQKTKKTPAQLAKLDAAQGRRKTGPSSAIDGNSDWREYIDTCAVEMKSGRSSMSMAQVHDGLVLHFKYPFSYSTVREYIYRVHGKPGAWRNG
jgi:hypothetical protein